MRRLKKQNPNVKIGVGGCVAQQEGVKILKRAENVDFVFGTDNLFELPEILKETEKGARPVQINRLAPRQKVRDFIPEFSTSASNLPALKAHLAITKGCNNYCSFCVVPLTRGTEVSRSPQNILEEATRLCDNGTREICLLGQNVNSYGRDLKIDNKSRPYFAQLLHKLNEIDGLERIRFTSPHPKDFKEETINAVKSLSKVCNQIHVPLQSGSSDILSKMHRGYNKEKFIQKVDMIRGIIPDVSLTTDIIVGFPGETDKDFQDTMDIVKYVEFDSVYMFQFSPRPGTKAYDMQNEYVDQDIIKKRFQYLKHIQTDISEKRLKRFVGTEQVLLIEKPSKKNNQVLTGKIDSGQITHIDNKNVSTGDIVEVKIIDSTPFYLKAELI